MRKTIVTQDGRTLGYVDSPSIGERAGERVRGWSVSPERAQRRANRRNTWDAGMRFVGALTVTGLAFGALYAWNTRGEETVTTETVSATAPYGVDVDRYGVVRQNGTIVGSLHDESGEPLRNLYLQRLGWSDVDRAHAVEDGVRFCALYRSGDLESIAIAADAHSETLDWESDPYALQVARTALSTFCPSARVN